MERGERLRVFYSEAQTLTFFLPTLTAGRTLLQSDPASHNGMTEADVEAGVRAALAAHGLNYDELTAPLAPSDVDATGPHGATAPAAAAPLNGRRLLFDPVSITKALNVNPNGTESKFAALVAGKNFTMPDALGSQIQTHFLNFNVSADQDEVVAKAVQVYSSIITPANMALFVRIAFHEAGTFNIHAAPGEQGGSNGSIRFELDWVSNGGIQRFGFPWLWAGKQIIDKHYPGVVSWADVIPLAAAAAIKNAGGPYVNVGYGRPEATGPDPFVGVSVSTEITKDWPLDALLAQWEYFGFDANTLCILSGAHTFGISATSSPQGLMARPFFTVSDGWLVENNRVCFFICFLPPPPPTLLPRTSTTKTCSPASASSSRTKRWPRARRSSACKSVPSPKSTFSRSGANTFTR